MFATLYTTGMREIAIIAHDIRSTHNVGALLRTAECMGARVFFTGYTPYPAREHDSRLPHESAKLTKQIDKTALGAQTLVKWSHHSDIVELLGQLKAEGYELVALEQTAASTKLPDFTPSNKVVILLGREVEGIDPALIAHCDTVVEIPQYGKKESLNVVQAAAMALYHMRFAAEA